MRLVFALMILSALSTAARADDAAAPATTDVKPETDARYFTRQRHVEVVQKRRYPKAKRLELAAFAGVIPNDAFVIALPAGLRLAWHTSEHAAWELSAAGAVDVDTSLRSFLVSNDANLNAQVRDRQRARVDAAFVWSPIYGKFAWMNRSVVYVDVSLIAGAGAVYTVADYLSGAAGVRPEALVGAAVRVFINRTTSLRFEYRQLAYPRADGPMGEAGGLAFPSELSIGVGFLFGGGGAHK
jgi:outer membrane beta-barrel protein